MLRLGAIIMTKNLNRNGVRRCDTVVTLKRRAGFVLLAIFDHHFSFLPLMN